MKAFLIIIICILYLVACICSEIWYLVILHKIGGYDSGIYPGKAYLIYSDTLYFIGILFSLIFILFCVHGSSITNTNLMMPIVSISWVIFISNTIINIISLRIFLIFIDLGVPFNCDFKYDDDLIDFEIRIFIHLYNLILKLLDAIKRIPDNLQKNLFVL
ncbi:hypothetical protein GLOIN_2v574929 [Rhizophagus irregularis DAOM 181602=DAOM 197198]|nr:hypothetical protein GLOIN_2v574929 [Rhizophagus irregularis DAOM 181602=DAOM 197198]